MARYGTGTLQYEEIPAWAKVPDGWSFVDIGGIAIDGEDNVYVLSRSEYPVLVFDRGGAIQRKWGEGLFTRAHGARLSPDGSIFCTDDGAHFVAKFTPTGELLMTLGQKGVSAETGYRHTWDVFQSTSTIAQAGPPFNRPTGVAITGAGDIFVSDGYGNSRVHHFDAAGKLLHSWGNPGVARASSACPTTLRWTAADVFSSPTARTAASNYSIRPERCSRFGTTSFDQRASASTHMGWCTSPS